MKRWYFKGHYAPREIDHDRAYKNQSKSSRKIYHFLCKESWLVKKSPTRRYCEWTYKQIGERVGLKPRQVGTLVRRLIRTGLIRRWYAGDSGSRKRGGSPRPPRYEIPASIGMVSWWRREKSITKKGGHGHGEKRSKRNSQTGQYKPA